MTDEPSPTRILPPSPLDVRQARKLAKHTQAEAADVVHSTARRWREWESGAHSMSPATWELYLLRTQAIIFKEPPMLTPSESTSKENDACPSYVLKL